MGRNFNKFKRGGNNNRGYFSKDFRGKGPRNNVGWKKNSAPKNFNRNEKFQQFQKVTLKEDQVGITEFVGSAQGFTGVVKARFSDFHVNEIDLDGTTLHLNDMSVPKIKDPDYSITPEELQAAKDDIKDVFTEEMWKEIEEIAKGDRTKPFEMDATNLDKDKRTTIHKVIKKLYETECNSTTLEKDGKKTIRVLRADRKMKKRSQWLYPGEYVHFLVYKENMDTSEVAVIIANSVKTKPSQINYCGTKDKRGKTTQKFCVRKRHPEQIVRAVQRIQSVKVGNFTFHDSVLKLGDLKGNRFRIALRHIDGDRAEIEKSLKSVKEYGFINYYGLQRFGNNAAIPTYQVGIALLKSDYKTACELILKPRDNDIPFMVSIRETWWKDRDSKAAAAMFHNDRFIEKKLLDGLAQYGEKDYANALRKIPRNMLLLYTHAYQSLIYNRVASKRIKEHGLRLIVGDLVYRNQNELDEITIDSEDALSTVDEASDTNVATDDVAAKEDDMAAKQDDVGAKQDDVGAKQDESVFKQKVKSLTEKDISSGKYTIFDIVLPQPGHDITYPANEVAQWYEDILAEEDLSSEKLKHGVKTFSLGGAYRKLLIQPQNMSWYFKKYNTPEEDVISSHFEKHTDKIEQPNEGEGKFTALVLDFCLPASVYATMFLREILKSDTSATHQAQIERDEMKKHEEKNLDELKKKNEENVSEMTVSLEVDEKVDDDIKTAETQSVEDDYEPEVKRAKSNTEQI